jgi:glycosyltransferase involved in cell wall biosynthesis
VRIAFDASSLAFAQKTGTGVYSEELIKAYEKEFSKQDQIIHTYRLSRRFRGAKFLRPIFNLSCSRETLLDPLTFFKGLQYDIFHGLNTRLPTLIGAKKIASVHDLFSIYGEFSNPDFKSDQAEKLKKMVDRSDHIIASCTFTKNQLVKKMNIPTEKISVVLLGVKERFLEDFDKRESQRYVRLKFNLKEPYLFFTGALEKRKNIIGLIEGYSKYISDTKNPIDLVLAGHPGFEYEKIKGAIDDNPIRQHIKLLGFVKEEDLAHLYRGCAAFVFPSFAEGFGMPVLEAMASGAPVVSSNTTSLPEAAGGFSWLVDPHSSAAIANSIKIVLSGNSEICAQTLAGQIYAREQTWNKVAKETRQVYERVINFPINKKL